MINRLLLGLLLLARSSDGAFRVPDAAAARIFRDAAAGMLVIDLAPTDLPANTRASVRLGMTFTPAGRPWPLFSASPWQMDVAFPVGDKSFTLPPGRSSRSYQGNPIVPGKIVALGGHMHDYGRVI